MDRYDKELIANILTSAGSFLMILVIMINFIVWDFDWFSFRMFVIGAILYLVVYYINRSLGISSKS